MKMKVGDYVKTKSGGIGKIIEINNNYSCSHIITDNETFGLGWDGEQVNWDFITEIVKSSPNIIDLIEVGDYVNGSKVEQVYLDGVRHYIKLENRNKTKVFENRIYNEDIKSVITREQLKNMQYNLESKGE